MGELSGGRSATCPTFFRSTSVRTRMDLQYSQTVCTLLDQRNETGAPQLGQFEVRSVTGVQAPGKRMHRCGSSTIGHRIRTLQATDIHGLGAKDFFEPDNKVPVGRSEEHTSELQSRQ